MSGFISSCLHFSHFITLVTLNNGGHWCPSVTLAPCSPPFQLLSKGLFHFFGSTWSPPGSCKSRDQRWFWYPHRKGHGFTEFLLCFMGSGGQRVLSAGLVLPYRVKVRESSDRPLSSRALAYSTLTIQVVYASSHLLVKVVSSDVWYYRPTLPLVDKTTDCEHRRTKSTEQLIMTFRVFFVFWFLDIPIYFKKWLICAVTVYTIIYP